MEYQLVKLYRRDCFVGYGIAVGGSLLDGLISTTVSGAPGESPMLTVTLALSNEHLENQFRIDLDKPSSSGEAHFCECCYKLKLGIEHNVESILHQAQTENIATMKLEVDTGDVEKVFEGAIEELRDLNTPTPEDTLHQALVAALPSMPSDKMKGHAESIAEAINAAYAKLKEPNSVSAANNVVFHGDIFVSPSASSDEPHKQISEIVRATLKRESGPGGLLFQK